jgi:hypothetical protein
MSATLTFAPDAAVVLGLASTAMPFARTSEEAAERWLRVLRLNGQAGAALRALGVSEGPLQTLSADGSPEQAGSVGFDPRDSIVLVTDCAIHIARQRGAAGVVTTDLLMAVMHVYGSDFDRVLRAHGTGRDEVLEQLSASAPS